MKKNIFVDIYIITIYLLHLIYLIYENPLVSYLRLFLGAVGLAVLFFHAQGKSFMPLIKSSVIFILSLSLLMLSNVVLVGNYSVFNIFGVVFSHLVPALFLLRYNISKITSYLIFLVYAIVITPIVTNYFSFSNSSWQYFASTSRNYVSFFLIFSLFPLFIYKEKHGDSIPLLPVLFTTVISFLAVGRGGIIMSSILLVGTILVNNFREKNEIKRNQHFVFNAVLCLLLLLAMSNSDLIHRIFSRFFSSGEFEIRDDGRASLWSNYLNNLTSFKDVVFGYNSIASTGVDTAGNLHNSYLQLHSSVGLLGVALFLILIIKSVIYLIKRNKYIYLVFLSSILFKGIVDLTFGFYYGDTVVMFFILLPFAEKNRVFTY